MVTVKLTDRSQTRWPNTFRLSLQFLLVYWITASKNGKSMSAYLSAVEVSHRDKQTLQNLRVHIFQVI